MLGVCIPDMHFVYILLGWKGSIADGQSHKETSQLKRGFAYYEQLTAIYAKDRATRKDAQTTADIIEEIDVEDVTTTNTHEETISMDAKLMFLWMRWIFQLHNHNHLETEMIPHFQRRKKKDF
ncbi:hypothetical protein PVK06_001329 [Gossypium arboreum]|uniref:Uncharacterized protein n=1 Tax=Gossypium arboreum TaxID=29729 RepID=A0ABR0R0X6_GOSAR|nr:hypothetical protein PVK06_001329 [Gossypium arboreum]